MRSTPKLIKTETGHDLLQSVALVSKVELETHSNEEKVDFELDISARDQAHHEAKAKVSVYLRGGYQTPEQVIWLNVSCEDNYFSRRQTWVIKRLFFFFGF